VTRGQPGNILAALVEPGLAFGQHGAGGAGVFGGFGQPLVMALGGLCQLRGLPFQSLDGFAGVAVEPGFALDVVGQLGDTAFQRGDGFAHAGLLAGQRVALHLGALQHGRGHGVLVAQRRQGGLGALARAGRIAGGGFGAGGLGGAFTQCRLGRGARLIGGMPAPPQQNALGATQLHADFAVSRCLPGLTRQLGQLRGQLLDDVLDSRQVGLGGVQPQFGLVPALVQARDAGRLLQHAPARARLGVDQLGDLALPDQRRRMRPGRGIGEQQLHVARAHVLAAKLVGRAGVAGDPAHDLQRIGIVEARRRQPFGIVDMQHHLGEIARRARGRAGEDHVLHTAAAHGGGAVFAHHPAQRLQQVGLAAAVRPDDAGQPLADQKIGGVDEALEAVQS
jgi:hypothetical protein